MKDLAVGKLVTATRKEWLRRYMAADKGCSGQEGQEASPKGRRMQTYLSVPEDETVHPYLPPSSHILVPQIWVKISGQVRSMRVQCDKPQVTNGEKATGQIVPPGDSANYTHILFRRSPFLCKYPQERKGQVETVEGRRSFSSILTPVEMLILSDIALSSSS